MHVDQYRARNLQAGVQFSRIDSKLSWPASDFTKKLKNQKIRFASETKENQFLSQ